MPALDKHSTYVARWCSSLAASYLQPLARILCFGRYIGLLVLDFTGLQHQWEQILELAENNLCRAVLSIGQAASHDPVSNTTGLSQPTSEVISYEKYLPTITCQGDPNFLSIESFITLQPAEKAVCRLYVCQQKDGLKCARSNMYLATLFEVG